MEPSRPYDLVLFGATGFTGGLTADYLSAHASRRDEMGAGRPQPRQARGREGSPGRRLLAGAGVDRGRRCRPGGDAQGRRVDPRGRHHRRPLCPPRQALVAACAAAGTDYCDLTGEPEFVDRCGRPPRRSREDRRPPGPLLRLRLDPARPRRLLHRQAAPRGRAADRQRLRPQQCRVLRWHLPLGDQRLRPRPADDGRREGAQARRAAPGWSLDPLGAGPRPAHAQTRRLGGAAADDRRPDHPAARLPALDRYGPDFTYGHHLLAKHLATVGALGAGVGTGVRAGAAVADPEAAAEDEIARRGAERGETREELVQGRLRR